MTTTRAALRGFLIQDPRLNADAFSESLSSVTQAGAIPGLPIPQQDTSMVLATTGLPTDALQIRTQRAGHPDGDAAFVWRYNGDTAYRGVDGPHLLTGWEFVERSTTAGDYTHPHAVTLSDGTIVVAVEYQKQVVKVYRRDPADGAWTSVEVYDAGTPLTYGLYPCLLLHPSGTLQCFSYRESGTQIQIRMHYSQDGGLSWIQGQKSVLPAAITVGTYITNRFRCGYLNGIVALILEVVNVGALINEIWQYASTDMGANFALISQLTDFSRAYPEVIGMDGALLVVYVTAGAVGTQQLPHYRRLGTAWDALTASDPTEIDVSGSMEWGLLSGSAFVGGDLAGWRDPDGTLYLLGRDHDAAMEMYLIRSEDGGETWEPVGMDGAGAADGAMVWNGGSTSIYPTDFCAVPHRGRVLVAHRFTGGVASDSLCAAWLGGWTTVTLPLADDLTEDPNDQVGWSKTWLPFDYPENFTAWTRMTGGSPTVTLGVNGIAVGGTAGDYVQWSLDPSTTIHQGVTAQLDINTAAGKGYLSVRVSNGTTTCYQARVEVTPNTITVTDLFGGVLDTVTSLSDFGAIQIMLAVGAGKVWAAWARSGEDREWTVIVEGESLTAGSLTTSLIAFGSRDSATTEVYLRRLTYNAGAYAGTGLHGGVANPADLLPRPYSALRAPIADGLDLQAMDGPTFRGEMWDIDPRYTYNIKLIQPDYAASPRVAWRSTDTSAQEIVWLVGGSLSDVHSLMDRIYGVYLGNINFRRAELCGRDSTGTWEKLVDVDAAASTGLSYERKGAGIKPASGSAKASYYFPMHMLAGSTFYNGTVARPIETNTDGTWGGSRAARLLLSNYEPSDAASGNAGELWSSEVVKTFETPTKAYNAFKLRIPSQTTADGYFRIGVALIGPVVVLGDEYSLGRSLGIQGSWTKTETRAGIQTFRRDAPVSRSAEIDWTEGVDVSEVTATDPDPDAISHRDGGPAVAAEGAAPYLVPGLYSYLEGALTPLVYLPSFQPMSSSSIANRQRLLYGRIVTESLRSDSVLGAEWGDDEFGEMFRVSKVRIEEIT